MTDTDRLEIVDWPDLIFLAVLYLIFLPMMIVVVLAALICAKVPPLVLWGLALAGVLALAITGQLPGSLRGTWGTYAALARLHLPTPAEAVGMAQVEILAGLVLGPVLAIWVGNPNSQTKESR